MSTEQKSALRTAIDNLIRRNYGLYNERLHTVIAEHPEKQALVGDVTVDMAPLILGPQEATDREVEKMSALARVVGDKKFAQIASNLQGLTNIAGQVDQVFERMLTELLPPETSPVARDRFAGQYEMILKAQLEERLFPGTTRKLPADQIITRQDDVEELLTQYDWLKRGANPRTVGTTGALELGRSQDQFFEQLNRISGLQAGPRK